MDLFLLRFVPSVPSTESGRVEVMKHFCSPNILGASLTESCQIREIQPLREEKKKLRISLFIWVPQGTKRGTNSCSSKRDPASKGRRKKKLRISLFIYVPRGTKRGTN